MHEIKRRRIFTHVRVKINAGKSNENIGVKTCKQNYKKFSRVKNHQRMRERFEFTFH